MIRLLQNTKTIVGSENGEQQIGATQSYPIAIRGDLFSNWQEIQSPKGCRSTILLLSSWDERSSFSVLRFLAHCRLVNFDNICLISHCIGSIKETLTPQGQTRICVSTKWLECVGRQLCPGRKKWTAHKNLTSRLDNDTTIHYIAKHTRFWCHNKCMQKPQGIICKQQHTQICSTKYLALTRRKKRNPGGVFSMPCRTWLLNSSE